MSNNEEKQPHLRSGTTHPIQEPAQATAAPLDDHRAEQTLQEVCNRSAASIHTKLPFLLNTHQAAEQHPTMRKTRIITRQ